MVDDALEARREETAREEGATEAATEVAAWEVVTESVIEVPEDSVSEETDLDKVMLESFPETGFTAGLQAGKRLKNTAAVRQRMQVYDLFFFFMIFFLETALGPLLSFLPNWKSGGLRRGVNLMELFNR